jgi:hypothetical protein
MIAMFQTPVMLAGIAGAAVPVVLHLLNRARVRPQAWGAMMFLDDSAGAGGHRDRVREFSLLGVRMGMVALLAVAMARPVFGGNSPAAGKTAIILLDDSSTMGFTIAGRSRLDDARESAREILASLRPGDQAQIVLLGNAADLPDEPTGDLQTLGEGLDDLTVGGDADVGAGLASLPRVSGSCEIFVIADQQASKWKSVAPVSRKKVFVIPVGGWESGDDGVYNLNPLSPTAWGAMCKSAGFTEISAAPSPGASESGPTHLWGELLGCVGLLGILELVMERKWG